MLIANFHKVRFLAACTALMMTWGGLVHTAFGQCSCMMEYMAEGNARPKVGAAYCNDTTPPQWYLVSTTGIATWKTFYNYISSSEQYNGSDGGTTTTVDPNTLANGSPDSYTVDCSSYAAWSTNTYNPGSATHIWVVPPGSTSQYTKNTSNGLWYIGATQATLPGISGAGEVFTNNPFTCEFAVVTGSYYTNVPGNYESDSSITETNNATPYTDAALLAHVKAVIPPFPPDVPTNWTQGVGGAAFHFGDYSYASCGRMQYRVQVPNSKKGAVYTMQWFEETYDLLGNLMGLTIQGEKVIGTGDPVNPAAGQVRLVDVPNDLCTIEETVPYIISVTYPGGGGDDGGGGGPGNAPGGGGTGTESN